MQLTEMRTFSDLARPAIEAVVGDDPETIDQDSRDAEGILRAMRSYVEGLGGRLELLVSLPDQTVILEIGE